MLIPQRATFPDLNEIAQFLQDSDLTVSGLDSPGTHLWTVREAGTKRVIALTGFELSSDGSNALIRSVAVDPRYRGNGYGLYLAQYALNSARESGASRAWLFSRRSGGFWQKLGFTSATVQELASALESTHQVELFTNSGQISYEVAWTRSLVSTEVH
ncbi:GNAT family N-acetyltransferase [Glutamicibacter sp.]|uniref:GNAT family N-acetyltransferase n=1 Tax=Glutamicibacter sp. TaxID=1931995 RepID=UPI0028BE52C3|nr:GNAT family N-acetyltransferase [Glutamicibacter sp.]